MVDEYDERARRDNALPLSEDVAQFILDAAKLMISQEALAARNDEDREVLIEVYPAPVQASFEFAAVREVSANHVLQERIVTMRRILPRELYRVNLQAHDAREVFKALYVGGRYGAVLLDDVHPYNGPCPTGCCTCRKFRAQARRIVLDYYAA